MHNLRYLIRWIGLTLLVVTAFGAQAATTHDTDASSIRARVGIWRGTIGGAKVRVCLGPQEGSDDGSRYYYLRHKFSIPLKFTNQSGNTLREAAPFDPAFNFSQPTAVWTLEAPTGEHMDGTWKSATGSRTAPIHLTRIATLGASSDTSCGNHLPDVARQAFNAPRVTARNLVKKALPSGFRVVSAINGNITTMLLPTSMNNAANFNHAARIAFKDSVSKYYDCVFYSGGMAYWKEHSNITVLSNNWVVTKTRSSIQCGGANRDRITSYSTWNLEEDKSVDPWSLVKHAKHCDHGYCYLWPESELLPIIVRRLKKVVASNCKGAVTSDELTYKPHPGKRGMYFKADFGYYVYQLCSRSVFVPWKVVEPFLSSRGRAMMRSVRSSDK